MTAVRGGWSKSLAAHRDQVVLAHKPLNPLGICNQAREPEQRRDAVVAIELVAQAEQLDMVGQLDIGFARSTGLEAAIIARAGNAGEFAEMLNVDLAGV